MSSLINAVNGIDFSLLEQGYKIGLDWLGQFARVIIESDHPAVRYLSARKNEKTDAYHARNAAGTRKVAKAVRER